MVGNDFKIKYRQAESQSWQEFTVTGVTIIGRSADCEISVLDKSMSRRHAQLSIEQDGVYITDLGSANGTFKEGTRLQSNVPTRMHSGIQFRLGDTIFILAAEEKRTVKREDDSGASVRLLYSKDGGAWQEFAAPGVMTIGRSLDCDFSVDDSKVSRVHARLEVRPDGLYLTDLGSSNGTRLEERIIPPNTPQRVMPGQVFGMGGYAFAIAGAQMPVLPDAAPVAPGVQPPVFKYPQEAAGIPPAPMARAVPPPKKKSSMGWVIALLGGGAALACFCVAVGVVLYMFGDELIGPDTSATEVALQQTREASQPDQQQDTPVVEPPDTPAPGESPVPTFTPGQQQEPTFTPEIPTPEPQVPDRSWLIMMYEDADDNILEYDIHFDVNESEFVGSTDQVQIVVQLDRYQSGYDGDGDWTTAKRFEITKDGNLNAITSYEVADLGEANMGDPNELVDFALWAMSAYPAQHYALILSDHGAGWLGGYSDSDSGDRIGIMMYELDQTLEYITNASGVGKLDLVGFDACLMSQIEVFTMIAPYAHYAVASEEVEPALGWAYAGFLGELVNNPTVGGDELARAIVRNYIYQDQRIVDDEARMDLLAQFGVYEDYPPDEVADYMASDVTLAAIDLSVIPALNDALNNLASAMASANQADVASARTYAQSYYNIFWEDAPPSYLDLGNFASMVSTETGDSAVSAAADQIHSVIRQAVLLEMHGEYLPGSTGIAFYFPNSDVYEATYDDTYGLKYTTHVDRFVNISYWDEFLEFHYTQKPFNP